MMHALILLLALQSPPPDAWELSGTVSDARGSVKGLYVSLVGPGRIVPVKTGSHGEFHFKGETPGAYSLRVQKNDETGEPRSRTLRLALGQKIDHLDIRIPQAAVISGRLSDPDKRPVKGLNVFALRKVIRGGKLYLEIKGVDRANDKGEYRIAALPEGSYVVAALPREAAIRKLASPTAAHAGDEALGEAFPPNTFAPGDRNIDSASVYRLRSGDDRQAVDIVVRKEPAYCLNFEPAGAMNDPRFPASAAGVSVKEWIGAEVQNFAGGVVEPGQTYEVCGLAAGEYRLHLHSFSADRRSGIGYSRATANLSRKHLALGPLALRNTQPLDGKVRIVGADEKDPLPLGIKLNLAHLERGILVADVRQATVAPSGEIQSGGVYIDTYRLSVDGLPPSTYVFSAHQGSVDLLTSGLRPGDGPLSIVLATDGAILSGTTTGERDRPVPDATVFLISEATKRIQISESDQSGVYRFDGLRPGD